MLYQLLVNCIPASLIIRTLTREIVKKLDDELKHDVTRWAAYYEHRMQKGQKDIYHIEAFVAKFMALYKKHMLLMFADDDDF
jgi:replication factor C subunit 3/5